MGEGKEACIQQLQSIFDSQLIYENSHCQESKPDLMLDLEATFVSSMY